MSSTKSVIGRRGGSSILVNILTVISMCKKMLYLDHLSKQIFSNHQFNLTILKLVYTYDVRYANQSLSFRLFIKKSSSIQKPLFNLKKNLNLPIDFVINYRCVFFSISLFYLEKFLTGQNVVFFIIEFHSILFFIVMKSSNQNLYQNFCALYVI